MLLLLSGLIFMPFFPTLPADMMNTVLLIIKHAERREAPEMRAAEGREVEMWEGAVREKCYVGQ